MKPQSNPRLVESMVITIMTQWDWDFTFLYGNIPQILIVILLAVPSCWNKKLPKQDKTFKVHCGKLSHVLNEFQYMKQVISIVVDTCDRRNIPLSRGIHTWSRGRFACPISTVCEQWNKQHSAQRIPSASSPEHCLSWSTYHVTVSKGFFWKQMF